jgi:tyrosyl-tRNA synthetase
MTNRFSLSALQYNGLQTIGRFDNVDVALAQIYEQNEEMKVDIYQFMRQTSAKLKSLYCDPKKNMLLETINELRENGTPIELVLSKLAQSHSSMEIDTKDLNVDRNARIDKGSTPEVFKAKFKGNNCVVKVFRNTFQLLN